MELCLTVTDCTRPPDDKSWCKHCRRVNECQWNLGPDLRWLGSLAELPSQEYWRSPGSIRRAHHPDCGTATTKRHDTTQLLAASQAPLARPLSSASPSFLENAASNHVKPPSQATFRPVASPPRRYTEIAAVNMNVIICFARGRRGARTR